MERALNSDKRRGFKEKILGVLRTRYEEVIIRVLGRTTRTLALENSQDITVLYNNFVATPKNLKIRGKDRGTPHFTNFEEFKEVVNKLVRLSISRDFTPAIDNWDVSEKLMGEGLAARRIIQLRIGLTHKLMDREFASINPAGDAATTLVVKASIENYNAKYKLGKYWSQRSRSCATMRLEEKEKQRLRSLQNGELDD